MKKMKYVLVALICIVLIMTVSSCKKKVEYGGDPIEFSHFILSSQGMSAESTVYEGTKTEDGAILEYYIETSVWDSEKNESIELKIMINKVSGGKEFYDELSALLGNCRIDTWDGFKGTNSKALDGSSMNFSAELLDGSNISASGTNNFPSNYGTLSNTLYDICAYETILSTEVYLDGFSVTVPESWIGKVTIQHGVEYTAFSVKKTDDTNLIFFIIDNDSYGYSSDSYTNRVEVGKLVKDDDVWYITARDLYSLSTYRDSLVDDAKVLIDTYEADRAYIISNIKALDGYTLYPEDGEIEG